MMDDPDPHPTAQAGDAALRDQFAQEQATAGSVIPILRYLLANEDNSIFSEEIVARVRGMVADLAAQLLNRPGEETEGHRREAARELTALTEAIVAQPALLGHIHALALEWQLTERLHARLALDPVLPPLLQALISSTEPATAELSMRVLAAQARFCQAQRRMRLPLAELPGDLLHMALLAMRATAGSATDANSRAAESEARIRAQYDESRCRLGLISRLVSVMGDSPVAALSAAHAGIAIFLTALARGSRQDRDLVALSTNEAQLARLALGLRAAGLPTADIEAQFIAIHPDFAPPADLDRISADRAAALLAGHAGQTDDWA